MGNLCQSNDCFHFFLLFPSFWKRQGSGNRTHAHTHTHIGMDGASCRVWFHLVFVFSSLLCYRVSSVAVLAGSTASRRYFLGDPFSTILLGLKFFSEVFSIIFGSLFCVEARFVFSSCVRSSLWGGGLGFVIWCAAALHTTRGADPSSNAAYPRVIAPALRPSEGQRSAIVRRGLDIPDWLMLATSIRQPRARTPPEGEKTTCAYEPWPSFMSPARPQISLSLSLSVSLFLGHYD